jgi:demethylmenaquinone methyltransferase/2-methoxy-6-polyprenyl-1,4-benzoquinol methylase
MARDLPREVRDAYARAERHGFALSCEPGVGWLLAALAAGVPRGGRVLELGTGVGTGLAWLLHGLGERRDVQLTTVDLDPEIQAIARGASWPPFVRFVAGDGAAVAAADAPFDLVFADAPGGKLVGLDASIAALRPGGVLLVDDMDLAQHDDPELQSALGRVRGALLADRRLVCAELETSSGILLATRR